MNIKEIQISRLVDGTIGRIGGVFAKWKGLYGLYSFVLSFLFLLMVGCAPTVSLEEHITIKSDLTEAQREAAAAEVKIGNLQDDLEEARSQITAAETQIERIKSELGDAQSQIAAAEEQAETMQGDLAEAQSHAAAAETQMNTLTKKIDKASVAAEILNVFFTLGLSDGEIPESITTESISVEFFLDLNNKIQTSEDDDLKEKFQAALLAESIDDQEMVDFFQYLLEIIVAIAPEKNDP